MVWGHPPRSARAPHSSEACLKSHRSCYALTLNTVELIPTATEGESENERKGERERGREGERQGVGERVRQESKSPTFIRGLPEIAQVLPTLLTYIILSTRG